jgi:CheY-like chemotaxis protein
VKLLENAIKFTEKGMVNIEVSYGHLNCDSQESLQKYLIIKVNDTGKGMNKRQIKNIFNSFYQVDSSVTRKHEGRGLGLTLSRKYARILGGDIEVIRSTPGKGSEFMAYIDIKLSDHAVLIDSKILKESENELMSKINSVNTKIKPKLDGIKVLLAEDNESIRELYSCVLKDAGAEVIEAKNGKEAFDMGLNRPVDVLLFDIQMPIMDGKSAMLKLRQKGIKKPILALSAHSLDGGKVENLQLGFDDHLRKPMEFQTLIENVLVWARPPTAN